MSTLAHHSPRKVSRCAVCLLIKEIPPSAYSLPDKKANHCYIKHWHNLHPLQFGNNQTAKQCTDYSAVDSKSAVIDVENSNGIFTVIIPLKKTKVKSCTYNACNYAHKNAIYKFSCVYIVAWCSFKCIAYRKQKSRCNNDSIPIHRQ